MNLLPLITLMRPRQWLKNLMLFFPPFLSGALLHKGMLTRGVLPMIAFCCAASSMYIFNDVKDLEQDSRHPVKCRRPLPSGAITRRAACAYSLLLLAAAVVIASRTSLLFLGYLSAYLVVASAYSAALKNIPLFDIFSISMGFIIRLYAGGEAFGVEISEWLFLTVFLLSIFLSVGKRFSEQVNLGPAAGSHRRTLIEYPEGFLESAMNLTGAAVLVTYSLYVIATPRLVYTVPLCLFGLLRYKMRIKGGSGGDPTEALVKDPVLLLVGVCWMVFVALAIYL
jgi:4-hydroxybenzoate polyprenyltransferase